jgi:hypothetical protein
MAETNLSTTVCVGRLDPRVVTLTVKIDARKLLRRVAVGIWFIKLGGVDYRHERENRNGMIDEENTEEE